MREADEFTEEELAEWRRKIDAMSQVDCARFRRFTRSGHPIFRMDLPLCEYFEKHFQSLGGMTPAVSKEVGW